MKNCSHDPNKYGELETINCIQCESRESKYCKDMGHEIIPEKCNSCNIEFKLGETQIVQSFHIRCSTKKEPKICAAHNALHANIGQYYEGLEHDNKWTKIKLDSSPVVSHSPKEGVVQVYATFYSGNKKFSVIRECEQPEEKVRVVTMSQFKEEIIANIQSTLFEFGGVLTDIVFDERCIGERINSAASKLFGEKVVVEN